MKGTRGIAASIALGIGSLAALLLALELGLRAFAAFSEEDFDALMDQPRDVEDGPLHLLDLIRRHPDPGIVYTLRPGTRGLFHGRAVRINALGMRGVERAREKPPGTFRVLALGDSHVFGWKVEEEEAFPAVVEELLARRSDMRVEVLNAGVPGYNAMQEVRTFELLVDDLDPDLVLINYVDNDMDLPNFLAEPVDVWRLRTSFLAELVRKRMARLRGWHLFPGRMVAVPVGPEDRYRLPPDRIPERYRGLQGWKALLAAYGRLARSAGERGLPVAVVFNWNDYRARLAGVVDDVLPAHVRQLAAFSEARGLLVIDPQERVIATLRERRLPHESLWTDPDDPHSSALRHRLVAEEIAERLALAGLVPGASAR